MNLRKAEFIATELMRQHGLWDLRWSFKFDRSLTRLGLCSHRLKVISLGRHATLVNSEEQVQLTILHEIAHALVGGQHGHDEVWRAKAIELGHSGERCGNITVKAPGKASILCKHCMSTWNIYRITKNYLYNLNQMWHRSCGRISQGQLVLERV
jgi:hypothetical protein